MSVAGGPRWRDMYGHVSVSDLLRPGRAGGGGAGARVGGGAGARGGLFTSVFGRY